MKHIQIERPESDFPELLVTIPNSWPYFKLEPFYDVHLGHHLHASKQFIRDVARVAKEPYTLTFNGGDLFENAILGSPGIFSQDATPHEQFDAGMEITHSIHSKMLFAISGNHEARTVRTAGVDLAKLLAEKMGVHYFPDYCFLSLHWRGNNFHGVIHHGSGAAQTPGAQRNAARKDMPWAKADFYWTGHLHQSNTDLVFQIDHNQRTNRIVTRQALVIINPSYLKYFGGYAAAKRYGPGTLGTVPIVFSEDGSIMAQVVARGRRL